MPATYSWTPLFSSLALLVALYWVSRKLAQSFVMTFYYLTRNEHAAMVLYVFFVLPGTLIHETSHWLMAQLVGVKTGNVNVLPKFQRKGPIRLGSVDVKGGNLLQLTLVGIAPFMVGGLLTALISYRLIDFAMIEYLWQDFSLSNLLALIHDLLQQPNSVLQLYLLYTVSDAMFLSASDVTPLRQFLVYAAITLVVFLGLGLIPPHLPAWTAYVISGSRFVATALSVALIVHLALWALFGLLQFFLEKILA